MAARMTEEPDSKDSDTNQEKEIKKITNMLVKRELVHIQSDMDYIASKANVYHNLRGLYYGPSFVLMFAAYFSIFVFAEEFDIVNVMVATFLVFCIHRMVHLNFILLDGKNGKLNFYADQHKILLEVRRKGASIRDEDVQGQVDWLTRLKELYKNQDESPHIFERKAGDIRNKIRNYRFRISILVPTLVLSFLLKKLPWGIEKTTGWVSFFVPEYLQWAICSHCNSFNFNLIGAVFTVAIFCFLYGSFLFAELYTNDKRNDPNNEDIV